MKITASLIGQFLLWLLAADVIVVIFLGLQISAGIPTPHITFWDEQLRILNTIL